MPPTSLLDILHTSNASSTPPPTVQPSSKTAALPSTMYYDRPDTSAAPSYPQQTNTGTDSPATPAPVEASSSSTKPAPSQGLYQCADCKKRYTRPEHLARHIKGHTLGKRFVCHVCGKAFARADLLKRHVTNHDNDDGTRKRRRVSPNSSRVSRACKGCAAARVKCEETKPCTRCTKRNMTCEYTSAEDEGELEGEPSAMPMAPPSTFLDTHTSGTPASSLSDLSASPTAQSIRSMPMHIAHDNSAASRPRQSDLSVASSAHNPVDQSSQINYALKSAKDAKYEAYKIMHAGQIDTLLGVSGTDDPSRMGFPDFLHNVLYEPQSWNQSRFPDPQVRNVLDYGDDVNYNLNDVDFRLLDHWSLEGTAEQFGMAHAMSPQTDDSSAVDMAHLRQRLVKMWSDAATRWAPSKDADGQVEQRHLPLPTGDLARQQFQETQRAVERVISDKLELASSNKILATILRACQNDPLRTRIASSFPHPELIDTLIHNFLLTQVGSVSAYVHLGTLKINNQWPEWLAIAASHGAIQTSVQTLRKFGYAIQDSIRQTLQAVFESSHASVMDVGLVQTITLLHDIGLWSANRRKMEIAECHLGVPVNMMRYRGRLRRSTYHAIVVDPSDEGAILEEKWTRWAQMESWKRLVFHCFIRDAQNSMAQWSNPIMSYAELTLPLPESKEIWLARSATEWKHHYLQKAAGQPTRPPSIADLIRDISLLPANHDRLDTQFSTAIFLHALWGMVFSWRQLSTAYGTSTFIGSWEAGTNNTLGVRHQELCKILTTFQAVMMNWEGLYSAKEGMLFHIIFMNLFVSIEDLYLFSGKEGEMEARRVFPILRQWSQTPDARQAIWQAGQVLRYAKLLPSGHLKEFYSVCVLHATLTLWAYSVIIKVTMRSGTHSTPSSTSHGMTPTGMTPTGMTPAGTPGGNMQQRPGQEIPVYLDAIESAPPQNFIAFGHGTPTLRSPYTAAVSGYPPRQPHQHHHQYHQQQQTPSAGPIEAALDDFQAFIRIPQDILRANHAYATSSSNNNNTSGGGGGTSGACPGDDALPPIVQNTCQVIKSLGDAAWTMGI